ncbi:MAG: hypothetical protein K0U72_15540 [Gammaproteobacteria bacterium]|nr:hypothetical protein [Gammaproteobacteria bacterium]
MKQATTDHIGDTIRIRRPPKVFTDTLGRTVWMSGVEPVELEVEPDIPNTNPYERNFGKLSDLSAC